LLYHLDDTQSFFIVAVQDSLDTGGFARARVAEKETVVRFPAPDESLRILDQLLFRDLISHQIFKPHMSDPCHRHDHRVAVPVVFDAERLMKAKFAYAEILIELHHVRHKLFRGIRLRQGDAHLADAVADTFVEHPAAVLRRLIAAQHMAAGSVEHNIKNRKVKIVKFFKNLKIVKSQFVDTALHRAPDLARRTECVLMAYQEKRQISMPEIPGKAVGACSLHQSVDAGEEQILLLPDVRVFLFQRVHKQRHMFQYLSPGKVPVEYAFLYS